MQKDMIKVMSVFGTRPEAIKMAPLVKVLEQTEGIESIVCVTAQHREMLDQVLEIFDLHPKYDLNIMQSRQTLAGITTRALTGLEEVMAEEKPDIVLVHGDTSTTFAGALAAYYNQVKVGHVEAGLRTYDKYQPFPEEMNRRLTGALTDLHFAPTKLAKEHLLKENIDADGIFITGNTVIDALAHTIEENYTFHEEELNTIDFKGKRVIAMTAHRRENLGQPLENICHAVKRIVEDFPDVEVVYAVHKNPAVVEPVHRILGNNPRIHLTDPLDLKDMHNLMCRSFFVMTDSGGLQEEVPSMGKPVLVLRNVTERPEGVEAGTLKLAGTDEETIYAMAKELLTEIVDFLHNPKKYQEIGAICPKGALLVGPPGTGKTLLAKAVAGEANVPFFSMSGSEFVEMFVGMGASKVRDLFKQANEKAPCIVFIDEIDTIGKKRDNAGYGGNDEREQTLNQLLSEMDGFDSTKGLLVLGATNRPEILDPALLRPGRFDRRVPVELPDLEGREAILKVHAKKVQLSDDVDFHTIARMASGASGAELANIVNEAALRAVRDGRKFATQADFEESIEVVIAGYQKKNRVLSNKEKLIVSYHEIGHA